LRPLFIALVALAALAGSALAADPTPKVYTVATSHLDTQWRWTIQTTIDEYLRATLDDNFALLERYPDYVFNFEGAFRYQLMREYYPEKFERLREYVRQGRWRVCGSWLDAVDTNLPSPESLFRHALYGNGWFARELGVRSVDVFLPDCFGFGWALPSVMAHSGLTGFSTQKLAWGSAYGTPFDIGRWRGVDGSEVVAAVNPGAYVSDLEGDVSRDSTVTAAIERTVAAGGPPVAFRYYGTGDTGGAPTEASVQWLEKSIASDGPIEVVSAGADQIFRELTPGQAAALPVHDGELVMTRHGAGCYTSQAAMKRWYRRCEVLADAAERAAALAWWLGGKEYPHAELERAWTRFLWHGFHDDLTGTSIPEAYAFSWNDLLLSQQEFAQVLESSLESVSRGLATDVAGEPLVVFNSLAHPRTDVVTVEGEFAPGTGVFGPDGREVPAQAWRSQGDRGPVDRLAFAAAVRGNGCAVYELRARTPGAGLPPSATWDPATGLIENAAYRVRLGAEGVTSLVDKATGRELLAAPPRLQLLRDDPERWPAWEIDFDDVMAAPYAEVPLGGLPDAVELGPAFARLFFTHEAAGSVFRETLTLVDDRLDWTLDIDWATKGTLLKAAFFTTARDTAVTYDLGLGAIRRGVNRPALYEVPAQRWADLTDATGAFGLTVMNDGRFGWDHPDAGALRLSLIHTPAVNERWSWVDDEKSQDLGRHRVTVSLRGHGPEWRTASVRAADELNQPLLAFATDRHPGPWGRSLSLLEVDHPQVAVRALKKSEESDWLVVRLQETTGRPAAGVRLAPPAAVTAFRELRADEVELPAGAGATLADGALRCDLAPYRPRTVALQLAAPPAARRLQPLRSAPLELPWDLDGISTREQPADGDLDGAGHSLPGALVPGEFVRDGVRFRTGPQSPGAANLVRCAGQSVALPEPDLPAVQLLMCAVAAPREAAFPLADGTVHHAWIPDGRAYFGQWDSRLAGDDLAHDAAALVPAYTTEADVGWVVTHRHDGEGRQEPYVFTHFYRVEIPAGAGARTLTLPDDPALIVLAASQTESGRALRPAHSFVDRPVRPSLRIEAPRLAFVDTLSFRVTSPDRGATIRYGERGGALRAYAGGPIALSASADLVLEVAAPGFPETTVRAASFTRLEPWPAAAGGGGARAAGLAARGYVGAWTALPDFAALSPVTQLASPTVAGLPGLPDEDVGIVFTGFVEAGRRGIYRFWLTSDDGSRLWIDDRLVLDHDGVHGSSAVQADLPLAAGPHAIKVEYFQHLGGRDLKLEWSGPGFARQEVPASAFSH